MISFIKEHLKFVIPIALISVLIVISIIRGITGNIEAKKKQEEADKLTNELMQQAQEAAAEAGEDTPDSLIMQMQDDLVASFGKVPEGYIWDLDGSLLSQGDKSLTAEEVVYSYFRGLQSLDMSTVQKFSRGSLVVSTYGGYFSETNKNTDYTDQFLRNMYRSSLLSMQIEGVENSTNFAENKMVFTVKAKMLDLTQKEFWKDDKAEIYKNLRIFDADESDSTRADIYLYEYISNYYSSDEAALRDVSFDITVQRYPDLDTGWLVSVDTDVDSACRYADGKLVVSYIQDQFRTEGLDYLESLEEDGSEEVQ